MWPDIQDKWPDVHTTVYVPGSLPNENWWKRALPPEGKVPGQDEQNAERVYNSWSLTETGLIVLIDMCTLMLKMHHKIFHQIIATFIIMSFWTQWYNFQQLRDQYLTKAFDKISCMLWLSTLFTPDLWELCIEH